MALSDALVKHCKPKSKAYTLKDIEGLALFVSPSGGKSWHFRFTLQGKRQRISLGVYPEVGLSEARLRCESNRLLNEWQARCLSQHIRNPAGYLFGMIRKAQLGTFRASKFGEQQKG